MCYHPLILIHFLDHKQGKQIGYNTLCTEVKCPSLHVLGIASSDMQGFQWVQWKHHQPWWRSKQLAFEQLKTVLMISRRESHLSECWSLRIQVASSFPAAFTQNTSRVTNIIVMGKRLIRGSLQWITTIYGKQDNPAYQEKWFSPESEFISVLFLVGIHAVVHALFYWPTAAGSGLEPYGVNNQHLWEGSHTLV